MFHKSLNLLEIYYEEQKPADSCLRQEDSTSMAHNHTYPSQIMSQFAAKVTLVHGHGH